VALGITSIVTALFANSSFSEGAPNGFVSKRLDIWNHTDPDRTGLIVQFAEPGMSFKKYVEYLLQIPLMFIVRQKKWIPVGNLTFGQYIREGFQGARATLGDFELHLSTVFPEVRLKQYLEIRGVDCQSPVLIPAMAAFWKGILYDAKTREEAWKLVSFASAEERLTLHREVARLGFKAKLGHKPVFPIAEALVDLSCASLGHQKPENEPHSECHFLQVIREKMIIPGKSPAEILLEKWEGEFRKNPARLIEYLSIG
jgi:glutamate--cysteine ligase